MVSALKFVFVAVAVICYMQTAEMAPMPADSKEAPTMPANLDFLANPDFWNNLGQTLQNSLGEDNLKKMGVNPDEVKNNLSNVASEFQKNFGEFTKTLQTMAEQQLQNAGQANKA